MRMRKEKENCKTKYYLRKIKARRYVIEYILHGMLLTKFQDYESALII